MRLVTACLLAAITTTPLSGRALADETALHCGPTATGFIRVRHAVVCIGGGERAPATTADTSAAARPRLPAFSGLSHTDAVLRADTAQAMRLAVALKGCNSIDRITSRVISDKPGNVTNGRRWWQERWVAGGCGRAFAYGIRFTADGKGGTDFRLSPEGR